MMRVSYNNWPNQLSRNTPMMPSTYISWYLLTSDWREVCIFDIWSSFIEKYLNINLTKYSAPTIDMASDDHVYL